MMDQTSRINFKIAFKFYQKKTSNTQGEIVKAILEEAKKDSKKKFKISTTWVSRIFNDSEFTYAENKIKLSTKYLEQLIGEADLSELQNLYEDPTEAFKQLGIVDPVGDKIHSKLDYSLIKESVSSEQKEIKILNTWMVNIRRELTNPFLEAIEKGVTIKILLLHPNSFINQLRSLDIGEKPDYGRLHILENLRHLEREDSFIENIEDRLYQKLPALNAYIFSDKIYSGWFLQQKLVQNNMFLEIIENSSTNSASQQIRKHYDTLWDSAEKVDLRKLKESIDKWNSDLNYDTFLYTNNNNPQLERMLGTWSMYYLEETSENTDFNKNKRISSIGRNIIKIEKSSDTGWLSCKMTYYDNSQPEYKGLVNMGLQSNSHLYLILFDPKHKKVLNLIFDLKNRSNTAFFGTFNVIYKRTSEIGCGLAVLEKVETEENDEAIPCAINPLTGDNSELIKDKRILNYLIFRERALTNPIRSLEDLDEYKFKDCPYSGYYKIYAYGRTNNEPCIAISSLRILPNHYIIHKKWKHEDRNIAYGFVDKVDENLRIVLENENYRRLGVLTLYVGRTMPKENSTIYCGTFSGITFREEAPVCTLVIMQYLGNKSESEVTPNKISIFSKEYLDIDEGIRMALTGRENNFLRFREARNLFDLKKLQTENEVSINYSRLFYESAIFNATNEEGNDSESLKMIKRAIYHGLTLGQLQAFESKIKKDQLKSLVEEDHEYQNLKSKLQDLYKD